MILFLMAMSVSLTDCTGFVSFLAVLGPLPNTVGSIVDGPKINSPSYIIYY